MKFIIIGTRSFFFYILIVIVYKWMGKREVGELSIVDFIVSMFIAELVAISIENYQESILISLIPIIILVLLQIISSRVALKHKKIRDILDGKPSVIVSRGKVNFKEMKKIRYNIDDLLSQLRGESIKSIQEVEYAILETNGKLSIFKKEGDSTYPLALILDGKIEEDVLLEIHKSKEWLKQELVKQNIQLENIFYGFYQNNNLYIIEKDKIK
mgnify:CR=1 FL=1